MPDLERMVQTMENWCNDDSHGYSQYHRYGPDYDCSSAVITALKIAGWDMGSALTTDHIRAPLVQQGWQWLPPNVPKQRGDILLNEDNHVAVYVGNGQLAEFAIDEEGGIAGNMSGDQTGTEAYIHGYYDYPWDGVLRYTGKESEDDDMSMACLIQPNQEPRIVWFDGTRCHNLWNPDQVEAIQMVARQTLGRELPCFALGTKGAPWYNRLKEAVDC